MAEAASTASSRSAALIEVRALTLSMQLHVGEPFRSAFYFSFYIFSNLI
jgi:hypothetical protein